LEHLEDQFGAKVTLNAGVGELQVFVAENVGAKLLRWRCQCPR
jgi:hypothetical protein